MDPKPEWMQGWNPYAILALATALAGLIGSAFAWVTGRGYSSWVEWQKFRILLRTEQAKAKTEQLKEKIEQEDIIRRQDKSKQPIDRIIEGNNTAEGYKQLLLVWDDRMRWLEARDAEKDKRIQELEDAHADCIEEHAQESTRAKNFEDRCVFLEKKYEEIKRRLQKASPNDPYPSPGFLKPPEESKLINKEHPNVDDR